MSWTITKVTKTRTEDTWQTGDSVIAVLSNTVDGEVIETKDFIYTYDDVQTATQFRKMVKGEVVAHLAHLNSSVPTFDVTNVFK